MWKREPFFGFLFIYFFLFLLSLLSTVLGNGGPEQGAISWQETILIALSQPSLTFIGDSCTIYHTSTAGILVSLLITGVSGLLILSTALWYYWQLFPGNSSRRPIGALWLTSKVSICVIALLSLYFLYALPLEFTGSNFPMKVLAIISLAMGAFNNAGYLHVWQLVDQSAFLQDAFFKIGIIIGTGISGVAVFVLDELFNPSNLKVRLQNPAIDWSFMTKLVVFGTAIVMAVLSCCHWWSVTSGGFSNMVLLDSVISSVYEISISRGFGAPISSEFAPSSVFPLLGTVLAAGPFTTGGGLTLLVLVYPLLLLSKNTRGNEFLKTGAQIIKRLFYLSSTTLLLSTLAILLVTNKSDTTCVLLAQWMRFSNNNLMLEATTGWWEMIVIAITIVLGRIGFILACFLTLRYDKD